MAKVNVGDRFDKLTVLERAEDIWSQVKIKNNDGTVTTRQGTTKYPAWLCKCDCGKEVIHKQSYLTKQHPYLHSCGKCAQIENPDYIPTGMTEKEKKDWDSLYKYVKVNIMNYDGEQALPKYVVTRLKGLCTGNFIVNKKTKRNANYSFETVLNTFKFCSPDIRRAINSVNFRDEQHRINYIFKIVESNLNNVYIKEKNIEKAKEEAKNINVDTYTHKGAKYKPKKKKNKFADLW